MCIWAEGLGGILNTLAWPGMKEILQKYGIGMWTSIQLPWMFEFLKTFMAGCSCPQRQEGSSYKVLPALGVCLVHIKERLHAHIKDGRDH